MTQRERQLLEWIRENPMISQQELADKAGITRSSVAVHISNLMKKGCITGKGYIVRTAPYVAVVGGVNMDIGAVSAGKLVARDSNPGHVTTSLGGVGRNIAHNLCLLGQQTAMVTVMGDDDFGRRVQENARDIGLDLSASAVLPDCRTGTYLYIAGPDGDMALAVNDMDIYQRMTPDFLRQRLDFINGADLVVLETNLPEDSIRWLCDNCRAHSGGPRIHHQGRKAAAGAGQAGGPEAQPPGGGAAVRHVHPDSGGRSPGGPPPAGHRLGHGVHLPGRGGHLCRRPAGEYRVGPLCQVPCGQRHRRRRRRGRRPGRPDGSGRFPCRHGPLGRGRRRSGLRGRNHHQPGYVLG